MAQEVGQQVNINPLDLNNLKSDILGDYIRDSKEQRIYRPKIN